MQLITERKPFAEALAWVALALPKRATVPALVGVKIEAGETSFDVSAFDYQRHHLAGLDATVLEPGACVVSGLLLRQLVTAMRGQDVSLELADDGLHVKSGSASYVLPTIPLEDYPTAPTPPDEVGKVGADDLAYLITAAVYAVSRDPKAEILQSVYLESDGLGALIATATDRYQAAEVKMGWQGKPFTTFPLGSEVGVAVAGLTGEVTISADHGGIAFTTDDRLVVLRSLAGKYPQIARLFPTDYTTTVEVDAPDLSASVKLAGLAADSDSAVRLSVTADGIAVAPVLGEASGVDHVAATVDGVDKEVVLSSRYLLNVLADRKVVRFQFAAGYKPVTVTTEEHPNVRALVMPVKL